MPDGYATRRALPLILVRGFGGVGVEDEKRMAYQGFNDGTVYPHKRGENYIYEGLILRSMKSDWQYQDATNVVGYYSNTVQGVSPPPLELKPLEDFLSGDRVVIDAGMALNLLKSSADPCRTLWVFRYYDLDDRRFVTYGNALVRLITFHTLRHTAATLMLEMDVETGKRKAVMGHQTASTTEKYEHLKPVKQRAPVEQLSTALPIKDLVTVAWRRASNKNSLGKILGTPSATHGKSLAKTASNENAADHPK
jgi:hypothetical protein